MALSVSRWVHASQWHSLMCHSSPKKCSRLHCSLKASSAPGRGPGSDSAGQSAATSSSHRFRLPKPMRGPCRSSSKPPLMLSRMCCRMDMSTSPICCRQEALAWMLRSCRANSARSLRQRTTSACRPACSRLMKLQAQLSNAPACCCSRGHQGVTDLGQCNEEGLHIGGQVAGGTQVLVHLPALCKLLEPVVKLAGHNHLHAPASGAASQLSAAHQSCLRAIWVVALQVGTVPAAGRRFLSGAVY